MRLLRRLLFIGLSLAAPALVRADPPPSRAEAPRHEARLVPLLRDGRIVGFKVYAIQEGSRFERARFANGDSIETIDGASVTSPDDALRLLGSARDVRVVVRRGETRVQLTLPPAR